MKSRLSWAVWLLSLNVFGYCHADDTAEQVFFKVSPTVCVIEKKQKSCEFNIQVHFRLAPYKELCLEITQRPQHTQCYSQTGLIANQFLIKTEHPLSVKLINPLSNEVVKQQRLSIVSYEAKDYRIKRRFGWSL